MASNLYFKLDYINTVMHFEEQAEVKQFKYSKDDNYCNYTFIKRKIPDSDHYDIISPFDYGGYEYNNSSIFPQFFKEFNKFCQKENIIAEFIRFLPTQKFDYELLSKYIDIIKIHDAVYIDLSTDFWKKYSRGRKSNINRIRKIPYSIENVCINEFYKLYIESMKRNRAHDYFYFNKEQLKELVENKFARIFGIFIDKKLISAIMILDDTNCSYYFLGGTLSSSLSFDANAMLFHEIALKLKKENKNNFFLGAGKNGVYDFKYRFSKKTLPYFIGKKIYNKEVYDFLVEKNKQEENDFFPKYRNKII